MKWFNRKNNKDTKNDMDTKSDKFKEAVNKEITDREVKAKQEAKDEARRDKANKRRKAVYKKTFDKDILELMEDWYYGIDYEQAYRLQTLRNSK